MTINNVAIKKGMPSGNNILKKFHLWYLIPTKVTLINVIAAKKKLNTK